MWKDRLFQGVMAVAVCGSLGLIIWLSAKLAVSETTTEPLTEADAASRATAELRPGATMPDVARWLKTHDFEVQDPPEMTDRVGDKPVAEAAGLRPGAAARSWRCVPRTPPDGRSYRLYLFFDDSDRLAARLAVPG